GDGASDHGSDGCGTPPCGSALEWQWERPGWARASGARRAVQVEAAQTPSSPLRAGAWPSIQASSSTAGRGAPHLWFASRRKRAVRVAADLAAAKHGAGVALGLLPWCECGLCARWRMPRPPPLWSPLGAGYRAEFSPVPLAHPLGQTFEIGRCRRASAHRTFSGGENIDALNRRSRG
ncbi:unnamed protein product, partial [Prorocentrum cordatum]